MSKKKKIVTGDFTIKDILDRMDVFKTDILQDFGNHINHLDESIRKEIQEKKLDTDKRIDEIWNYQRRQDDFIDNLKQTKITCMEEVQEKVDGSSKSWWKKVAIVYGIIILLIFSGFTYTYSVNDKVEGCYKITHWQHWIKTDFSKYQDRLINIQKQQLDHQKEYLIELGDIKISQTEIKNDIKDTKKIVKEHLNKHK